MQNVYSEKYQSNVKFSISLTCYDTGYQDNKLCGLYQAGE